ncbi:MAG: septum formation initiator family protein [Actinomycetota bacterium]|nr:septum formation initiator family protein [Actinomycetota bacterium]
MAAAAPARARAQRAAAGELRPRTGREHEPARRPRTRLRPRAAGGVLWIALVALLLVGIVALNVAVLRLNVDAQVLEARKDRLVAENAEAESELSSLAAAARIEEVARGSLGLVDSVETHYVRVRRGR